MLKDLADRLGHAPSQKEINSQKGTPSASTYCNRFGGLKNASSKAGLDPNRKHREHYSNEELLEMLKDLADRLGHDPSQKEINSQNGMPSASTYHKRFGSLKNALLKAGLLR
jgi:SOS-response transcriptional repressor LexA